MGRIAAFAAAVAAAGTFTGSMAAQQTIEQLNAEKLYITAFAVNMSNIAPGANASVDIRINSWSTDEERATLITTMLEKGSDALLRELQKQPSRGRFSIPGIMGRDPLQLRLGHDLRYTRQVPLPDGGRRIVIATDRYISFAEARNQPRSFDYRFTLTEIHVDKDGKGEGKMAVATKINFDKKKNQIELENYASEPVRLNTPDEGGEAKRLIEVTLTLEQEARPRHFGVDQHPATGANAYVNAQKPMISA
jgi:hypothetical protein